MRALLLTVLLCCSQCLIVRSADPGDTLAMGDITPAVASAIRSGNAQALAAYFAPSIDLTVPESEGTYSKAQAELIVKGFFNANHPSAFVIQHQGSSGEGSQFCIGSMTSTSGNFRVYFLIKTTGGTALITQLQFEAE